MKFSTTKAASAIALSLLISSCAVVELSGTMTRKTGEAMEEYSQNNDGIIGKMAGFGGRINKAVGTTVEGIGKKDGTDGEAKPGFVEANKQVFAAAADAGNNKDTQAPDTGPKIGNLALSETYECSLQLPAQAAAGSREGFVMQYSDYQKEAVMNINGEVRKLKQVSSTKPPREERKGARTRSRYVAGDITVQVDKVATSVCGNSKECESTGYDATLTVSRAGQTQKIKADAFCGS